jgi:hypothetical protein
VWLGTRRSPSRPAGAAQRAQPRPRARCPSGWPLLPPPQHAAAAPAQQAPASTASSSSSSRTSSSMEHLAQARIRPRHIAVSLPTQPSLRAPQLMTAAAVSCNHTNLHSVPRTTAAALTECYLAPCSALPQQQRLTRRSSWLTFHSCCRPCSLPRSTTATRSCGAPGPDCAWCCASSAVASSMPSVPPSTTTS